jgi:esterase/lipase/1-acyl-sn-glycerol-3-phosphate acyltransferase
MKPEKRGTPLIITELFLSLIEKILKIDFEIKGEEKIPKDKSILFVANHFTRAETMIMPYLLNKIKGLRFCRSLAYKDLFLGKMGEYLTSVKVLSTGEAGRDKIIIDDLNSKKYNWIIYPEGEMIKDKKIFTTKPTFIKRGKLLKSSARTGVAVLAMKAEMDAKIKGNIYICPINISYRPLHVKPNKLMRVILRIAGKRHFSTRLKEEISFESSLLSYSMISVEFGNAICVKDYISQNSKMINSLPFTRQKKRDLTLDYLRYPLTNYLMHQIYLRTPLTFDHFFSLIIYFIIKIEGIKVTLCHLREIIFHVLARCIIMNQDTWSERFRISSSIDFWNLPKLIMKSYKFTMFEEACQILTQKGFATISEDNFIIFNKEELLKKHEFHEVRVKNIFQVLFNEISYCHRIVRLVELCGSKRHDNLVQENGLLLKELMEIDYKRDRASAGKLSKPENIGKPIFLMGTNDKAILLSHGYKSAPAEMNDLALHLNSKGFTVYVLRLKGHGTTPEDMKTRTAEDWIYSYVIGYEILSRNKAKIFLGGFSMGGLLALVSARNLPNSGIITISAALHINDFKFRFVRLAKIVTEAYGNITKTSKDFIEDIPENPDINYKKHYFVSMEELSELMKIAEKELPKIKSPILAIQGKEDPIVKQSSGMEIYKNVSSHEKELYEPNFGKRHVIVKGEGSVKLFERISNFLSLH